MDTEEMGLAAALAVIAYAAVAMGLSVVRNQFSGREPTWLPGVEYPGYATSIVDSLVGAVEGAVLVALGLGLGYAVSRRSTLPGTSRTFLLGVGAGAVVGNAILWLVGSIATLAGGGPDPPALLLVASLVQTVAEVALVLTVAAIAGAALADGLGRDTAGRE